MSAKKGLVMELQGKAAYIMTSSGEFVKVKIDKNKALPILGGEYSSTIFENPFMCISKFKYAVAACLLFFVLSLGGGTFAYYTPTSTVTININPSIEFKLNRWSRVIASDALNSDGGKILSEIKAKNKLIKDVLLIVINQAKQDKYINDSYINTGKTITINIVGKEVNLSSLEKELSKGNVNVKIDSNGNNIYNKNNRKLDNLPPEKNSDKNINVSTSDNSSISKAAIDKNNSNVNINNKDNRVLGNTGGSNNNSSNKYKNSLENDNKKDNNNANLEKSEEKLKKDKTNDHHDSNKESKDDDQDENNNKN